MFYIIDRRTDEVIKKFGSLEIAREEAEQMSEDDFMDGDGELYRYEITDEAYGLIDRV